MILQSHYIRLLLKNIAHLLQLLFSCRDISIRIMTASKLFVLWVILDIHVTSHKHFTQFYAGHYETIKIFWRPFLRLNS